MVLNIGTSGEAGIDQVAGPVGEALIMTAFGLAVAIPAVLGYNAVNRANRKLIGQLRRFAQRHQHGAADRRHAGARASREGGPAAGGRGDRKAEYESVLRVMAAAQRADVLKFGFVTDPGDADGQAHPSTGPDVRRSRP